MPSVSQIQQQGTSKNYIFRGFRLKQKQSLQKQISILAKVRNEKKQFLEAPCNKTPLAVKVERNFIAACFSQQQ
ncbi:MAG: hypothetical protein LBV41_09380 [Cytophagaceae bacterium]|jgi:hypothetical protein|nr:hypothetical protein [Cytophagaceae bacterium]